MTIVKMFSSGKVAPSLIIPFPRLSPLMIDRITNVKLCPNLKFYCKYANQSMMTVPPLLLE